MSEAALINELQTHGMRMVDPTVGMESRRGGAGPTDHKAVTIGETTVMIPVHTARRLTARTLFKPLMLMDWPRSLKRANRWVRLSSHRAPSSTT